MINHGNMYTGGFNDIGIMKAINDQLYVYDHGNNRIQILNTKFEYIVLAAMVMEMVNSKGQLALPRTERRKFLCD